MSDPASEKDILLAEDDRDDRDIFEMALNELEIQYQLRHAHNGDALFVMLKDKMPYILFLDIHMPCQEGTACLAELRKDSTYDQLPIIMYTSHMSDKIVEETFRSGANLYVAKTATFTKLVENLRKVFAIDWKSYLHYPPRDQFFLS